MGNRGRKLRPVTETRIVINVNIFVPFVKNMLVHTLSIYLWFS